MKTIQRLSTLPSHRRRRSATPQIPAPTPPATYPMTAHDIHTTICHLRDVFPPTLPDEILKQILYHADYDCLHVRVTSQPGDVMVQLGQNFDRSEYRAYVETPPITGLSLSGPSGSSGRVRTVRLQAMGHDQGWVEDPTRGVWSWFEVHRTWGRGNERCRMSCTWAQNRSGDDDWQRHEAVYVVDEEKAGEDKSERAGLAMWVQALRDGDRVSIVPMARYGGWECHVNEASIDIEIEVWR